MNNDKADSPKKQGEKNLNVARSTGLGVLHVRTRSMKLPPKVTTLAEKIRGGLRRLGVMFRERKGEECVVFHGFIGTRRYAFLENFPFRLFLGRDHVTLSISLPGHVPLRARLATLDFLGRMNSTLTWGSFKLDMIGDGELTYELTLPNVALVGGDFKEGFHRLVCTSVGTFNGVAKQLILVILGQKAPADAFKEWSLEDVVGIDDFADCNGSDDTDEDDGDEYVTVTTSSVNISAPKNKPSSSSGDVPDDYAIDILNVCSTMPLDKIIEGARRFQAGNRVVGIDAPRFSILLDGPPGCGKTSFGRHLANQIGSPLMLVRGSDIISPLVGQTERNLSEKFKKAASERAVLFLDEIDSLLWSRDAATRAWEVSEVNELLVQVERASCIVLGATNFVERLDAAVARRFTFKIALGYLTDGGKVTLFTRMFKRSLNTKQSKRLMTIPNLCPGDFRTVKEGLFYIKERPTIEDYLSALEKESETKEGHVRPRIGF